MRLLPSPLSLLVLAGLLAPATGQAARYQLDFLSLVCNATTDVGDDEVYLEVRVDGGTWVRTPSSVENSPLASNSRP